MAMVNPILNLANAAANVKDSRWLTLEVCREYQRNKCTRSDTECKFAHPPAHVEVQNGRVTACFDSIKGKCQRKDPPCKYLHPPQHLREQLLQNGRNNLILKNLAAQAALNPPIVPGMIPTITPYLAGSVPQSSMPYSPYGVQTVAVPSSGVDGTTIVSQPMPGVIPTALTTVAATQPKLQRADRLEVCREFQRGTCTRQPSDCRYAHPTDNVTVDCSDNQVTVCMDFVKGKCTRDSCKYFHPPPHLQAQIKAAQQRSNTTAAQALQSAIPPMIPYKRLAVPDSKSGLPVYQPGAATNISSYQHALAAMHLQQLGQQQYVPVAYKNGPQTAVYPSTAQSPGMPIQQSVVPVTMPVVISPAPEPALVAAPASLIPTNAHSINYFDGNQQLLDTLPVCQDFRMGRCNKPMCKNVHIIQDYVEVMDGRVAVCRDAVRGKCTRPMCKYYHIPVDLPPSK
ncbi:hypothetical protein FSP39_002639 [Pinctada imbricata]|uniref:C3H1-type domain-containing protein n=1 Tax=Pinctada imbricata TaxID=66713 RepID=A0AA89C3J4_PINIB|nr:hypothetical protein FSP39_002639 [Pinctada imbricata]